MALVATMQNFCVFLLVSLSFIYSPSIAQDYQRIKLEKEYSEGKIIHKEQNGFHEGHRTKRSTPNKISLANFKNSQYYAEMKFGSNDQVYKIMFDTGSGISWIPEKYSKENTCARKYKKNFKSNTFQDFNTNITISYMEGTVTMKLGSDSVTIGNMRVKNQTLGLAIKSDCERQAYDGIIGMSFYSINHSSIIKNMLSQGLIKEPVFAFYLNRNQGSTDSELTIGGYNSKYITNNQLNTIQVTDPEHWQVPMESVLFGEHIIAIDQKAIIDSGASTIVAPIIYLRYILGIIRKFHGVDITQENGFLLVTRNKSLILPNFSFIFGNNIYNLTDTNYTTENGRDNEISIFFTDYYSDTWILGDPFLQNYYLIFNFGLRTISFPKTRSANGRYSISTCNSMNNERIQEIIYILIFVCYMFNYILRT